MSWPSFYGYKYTPIGLRQREVKDEYGSKTFSTTVHLPEGGHLLDIERRFNPDGSVSKKESNACPQSPVPLPACTTPRAVDPLFEEPPSRHSFSDLERQADDIIANFRARQPTGLEATNDLNVIKSSKSHRSSEIEKTVKKESLISSSMVRLSISEPRIRSERLCIDSRCSRHSMFS